MSESRRGGPGRGQGRKPIKQGEETVPLSIRVTVEQRKKLTRLGGAEWVRDRIDRAKENNELTEKQQELYELMSDISEECYCAGWIIGNEYAIWDALTGGDRRYGMGEIEAEQLEKCRALSEELGGWIVWVRRWGPRFIPMDRWIGMVAANNQAKRASAEQTEGE